MLNSFFSMIPNVYWLGTHKFLKTDLHFIARKWNNEEWKKYFILFLEHNTTPN